MLPERSHVLRRRRDAEAAGAGCPSSASTPTTRRARTCSTTASSAPRWCSTGFNYDKADNEGVEVSAKYHNGNFTAYANLAWARQTRHHRRVEPVPVRRAGSSSPYIANTLHLHRSCPDDGRDRRASPISGTDTRSAPNMIYGSGLRSGFANTDHCRPTRRSMSASRTSSTVPGHEAAHAALRRRERLRHRLRDPGRHRASACSPRNSARGAASSSACRRSCDGSRHAHAKLEPSAHDEISMKCHSICMASDQRLGRVFDAGDHDAGLTSPCSRVFWHGSAAGLQAPRWPKRAARAMSAPTSGCGAAARSQPVGHVRVGRPGGEGRHDRPRARLGRHLDGLARQDDRARRRQRTAARRAARRSRRPRSLVGRSTRRRDRARPATSSTRRVAEIQLSADSARARTGIKERIASRLERIEAALRPAHQPRHRRARHHRRDGALRRAVRHRLGHHEQLHRHLEGAHHQSRGGRARHRRGAAGDRLRARGRDSGGRDLQRVRALDRRLSGAARRRLGRGAAAGQPRPRPPRAGCAQPMPTPPAAE